LLKPETIMEVADPPETSIVAYQTTWYHLPEDSNVELISKLKNESEHEIINCYSGLNLEKETEMKLSIKHQNIQTKKLMTQVVKSITLL